MTKERRRLSKASSSAANLAGPKSHDASLTLGIGTRLPSMSFCSGTRTILRSYLARPLIHPTCSVAINSRPKYSHIGSRSLGALLTSPSRRKFTPECMRYTHSDSHCTRVGYVRYAPLISVGPCRGGGLTLS